MILYIEIIIKISFDIIRLLKIRKKNIKNSSGLCC